MIPTYGPIDDNTVQTQSQYTYDTIGKEVKVQGPSYKVPGGGSCSGTAAYSYDGENHLITANYNQWTFSTGGTCADGGAYTGVANYGWGPDGHVVQMDGDTLHWDGDVLLCTSNSSGNIDDIKMGILGDYTAAIGQIPAGMTVWDRDMSGMVAASHAGSNPSVNNWGPPMPYGQNLDSFQVMGASIPVGGQFKIAQRDADGIWDGKNAIHGVRSYDPQLGQWGVPDTYPGIIEDPMSQKPFMFNRNSPFEYQDPSGYDPLETGQFIGPGLKWIGGALRVVWDTPDGVYHMGQQDVDNANAWGQLVGGTAADVGSNALDIGNPVANIAASFVLSQVGRAAGGVYFSSIVENNIDRWNRHGCRLSDSGVTTRVRNGGRDTLAWRPRQ